MTVNDYTDSAHWARWYTGNKLIWHRVLANGQPRFPKTLCGRFIPEDKIEFEGHVSVSEECSHCHHVYQAAKAKEKKGEQIPERNPAGTASVSDRTA